MWIEEVMPPLFITVPFDLFGEEVVQRCQNVAPLGVMAAIKLFELLHVTPGAVLGSNDRRDVRPVVIKAIDVTLLSEVTLDAADSLEGVRAAFPVIDDAGR